MRHALRRTAFLFFAVLLAMPARADPLIFFLMSAAREIVSAAVAKDADRLAYEARSLSAPGAAATYPGTAVEPETLRRVIDESFVYLSSGQRREVFESLNEMLLDPKIGPTRAALIEYFLYRALTVRAAHIQLEKLSYADKQRLAVQFRQESAELPGAERRQLRLLLEQHLLPVPTDLNQLLLAELPEGG